MALEKSGKNPAWNNPREHLTVLLLLLYCLPHRNGQFTTCMDFDLLYSLPSVLSTCGWTVPYLASNVGGGDCGAVVI